MRQSARSPGRIELTGLRHRPWCTAQFWLGETALYSGDLAAALGHFTAVRDAITDRGASRALADCLRGRSATLTNMGRFAEAADDDRRSLALARELGYPAGQALALAALSIAAYDSDDLGSAVQLARDAEKITARSREAGDLWNQMGPLPKMAILDLRAGRIGDAAALLREALQIAARTGARGDALDCLGRCGYLCAVTGRCAEALTMWAAALAGQPRQAGQGHVHTSRIHQPARRRAPLPDAGGG